MADQRIQYNESMVGAGHPSLADTLNRALTVDHNTDGTHEKLTVGSDADGDLYYRASGALARLAKGVANFKLFMDAVAAAPEWAAGIKIGSFTRDISLASGTQAITGVGFKPAVVLFLAAVGGTKSWSIGWDMVSPAGAGLYHAPDIAAGTLTTSNDYPLVAQVDASNYVIGQVTTMGADGFTTTWTKTGSPTGTFTIYWLALR